MNNIEELVKAAIDEFGELAFERFEESDGIETINLPSNRFLIISLSDESVVVKLKPMPELFAHDVKIYGDNAYQMWQLSHEYNENNGDYYWINCTITLDFNLPLKYRRKASAHRVMLALGYLDNAISDG